MNIIEVRAVCSGNDVDVFFKPIPHSGGTAPCSIATVNAMGASVHCDATADGGSTPSGMLTLSGAPGTFRVTGTCNCTSGAHAASVHFQDVAMSVQ